LVFGNRPEEHIWLAIERVLADVLGRPTQSLWDWVLMALRNASKPSRVLRMTYTLQPVRLPGPPLNIKIEANVTERTPHRAIQEIPFAFLFQGKSLETRLNGYDLHEMLGTKLRALFQREAGRDLFDLFWALTKSSPPAHPAAIIESFLFYVRKEGVVAGRAEFIDLLQVRLKNRGFCADMEQLLRAGIVYDPQEAGRYVQAHLLNLLPP
jgi:hypothetical protein